MERSFVASWSNVLRRAAIFVFLLGAQIISAQSPLPAGDYSWMSYIRQEHPRMFLTKEDIPQIRETASSFEKNTFQNMKERADVLVGKPVVFPDDPLTPTGEGKENRHFGYYASDAAMLWLITQDPTYLNLAKDILVELTKYYQFRVEHDLNIEWYAMTQICALCAYDWIYNDLLPEERISIGKPLYEVLCDVAWHGPGIRKKRFRENTSDHTTGAYGVSVLPWYIGLTFWKEGFDDAFCESMVRSGYDFHQKLVSYRAEILGKNGGGASGVPAYSLAVYPYTEYDFMYTYKSATGIDIAPKMEYMIGYLNYIDWVRLPGNKEYGYGDCSHFDCSLPHQHMNLHVWEIANLFGETHPEILPVASRLIKMFPSYRKMENIPFLRLLHKINPLDHAIADEAVTPQSKSMYFDTMGQLYMRSGVGDNDTYLLFVSGGNVSQHKHYDNNNFIIYKNGYRALDSGTRPEPGWHLPYYYARTVAHNCVTIDMPGEKFKKYWGGPSAVEEKNLEHPNDGGQCNVLGSKVLKHEETADYVYVASDATESYHQDKAELVMRELVWCAPDVFVVFDRVVSDKVEYAKRWLYHMAAEPRMKGKLEFSEVSQGGKSICRTLFPKDAEIVKVGGPGKQFWSDYRNWEIPELTPEDYGYVKRSTIPSNEHPLVGQWRVEVLPGKMREKDFFMHIIQVGDENLEGLPKTRTFENAGVIGVEFKYNGKKYRLEFDKTKNHGCTITVTNR